MSKENRIGEKMRIGMFAWESLYSIKVGGMAPHVSELAEALAKRGHEVHIFTRRGNFDAFDQINGVHYQRSASDDRGDIVYQMDRMSEALFDSFERVQKIYGRFDIIHGHDWHPVPALHRIKEDYHLPYLLTIHSTEWGRNGGHFGNSNIFREISQRERTGIHESSQIIVASERMQSEVREIYSIPREKTAVIPNGIVQGKIHGSLEPQEAKDLRKSYDIGPQGQIVLFCGRMTYQKGPDLLVKAIPFILEKHRYMTFIFAGEGDMSSECERLAKDLKIERVCRFLGYISGREKERLLGACDIVCVPSRNEPFGIIILEAWDAGKPVVATEAVNIVRNFVDGLLAYIQPESIAWCISRLLDNPDEMKKQGLEGQRRIEAEFDWDRIAERTEAVYNKCLGAANTDDA